MSKQKLTQAAVATKLGIDQPKISKILKGKISEFSIERILGYLLSLGYNVNIDTYRAARAFSKGSIGKVIIGDNVRPLTRKRLSA